MNLISTVRISPWNDDSGSIQGFEVQKHYEFMVRMLDLLLIIKKTKTYPTDDGVKNKRNWKTRHIY